MNAMHAIRTAISGTRVKAYLILFMLICATARGQVNMEAIRNSVRDSGFSNRLAVTYELIAGNSNFYRIDGSYRIDYLARPVHLFALVNYSFGKESGESFLDNGFVHIREVYALGRSVSLEAFQQTGWNKFINQKNRSLAGLGGRLKLLEGADSSTAYSLFLGIGGMYEEETEGAEEQVTKLIRSTNYLSLNARLSDRTGFNVVSYYQPAVTRFDDFRLLVDAELWVTLFRGLSITSSLGWRYNSDPYPGIGRYDLDLKNGLTLEF